MKILVTGGAGFIGSHVVDHLVEHRHEVVVLDSLDPQVHGVGPKEPRHILAHQKGGAVQFIHGTVTDRTTLENALDGVETVVHLAAAVGVGQSMYEPYYYVDTNANGTGLLLDIVVKNRRRVSKLIVASSMSLYGEGAYRCPSCDRPLAGVRSEERLRAGRWEVPCASCGADLQPLPTPESKAPDIASVYAATKKHQEDLFVSFGQAYRIPTFALRFFNVYGPRQSLNNPYTGVAAIFLSRLLNGHRPLVFEDGGQSRDFIEVRDVAGAVTLAAESGQEGAHVLNIGTGAATSVRQVGEALARRLGLDIQPEFLGRYRAGDIRHCIADAGAVQRILGFKAETTFDAGLADLIAWCGGEQPRDQVLTSLQELERRGLVR